MAERRRNTCLVLLGLVPCLMALIAEAIPAHPVAPQSPPKLPELAFVQYGVSYPEVPSTPVIGAQFEFQNRSDGPLTIEDLKPSCGCLRVQLAHKQKVFQPGESGAVLVHMHTANERPGPHFYTIDVAARGREEQRQQLTFRIVLPERKVSIEPNEVYFYQTNGKADSRTVYVTDYRDQAAAPLEVTAATPASRQLTAEVLPAETDEAGHRRIPIVVRAPAAVDPGREETFVRVETSDRDFSQMAFPVLIQGPPEVYGPPVDLEGLVDIFEILESRQSHAGQETRR